MLVLTIGTYFEKILLFSKSDMNKYLNNEMYKLINREW